MKHNLEHDIISDLDIRDKVVESDTYAQNLYAALCNQAWQHQDVIGILRDDSWSCTWRYAGGIISGIRCEGSYVDWYCSGIGIWTGDSEPPNGYVNEGVVTEEIRRDLARLGWLPVEPKDEDGY